MFKTPEYAEVHEGFGQYEDRCINSASSVARLDKQILAILVKAKSVTRPVVPSKVLAQVLYLILAPEVYFEIGPSSQNW